MEARETLVAISDWTEAYDGSFGSLERMRSEIIKLLEVYFGATDGCDATPENVPFAGE